MADKTAIQWTATYHADGTSTPGATWNPIRGTKGAWACVKVSPACAKCYAERLNMNPRFGGHLGGELLPFLPGMDEPRLDQKILLQPHRWQRPRKVFVCSMTDIGWEQVTDEMRLAIWRTMALTPRHTFLVLTKRPEVLRAFLHRAGVVDRLEADFDDAPWPAKRPAWAWPLPNVWVGATVENQRFANRRIPELLRTPAAVRFLSLEPLLGPVNLHRIDYTEHLRQLMTEVARHHGHDVSEAVRSVVGPAWLNAVSGEWSDGEDAGSDGTRVDWVITGGESGKGHRTTDADWVRTIRDQCVTERVAYFHKQWGGATPKSGGRLLDGREWNEFPAVGALQAVPA